MSYTPYKTATQWQQYFAALNDGPSDQIKIAIDTLGATENGSSSSVSGDVFWVATAATNSYTSATVPGLANQTTRSCIQLNIAGGIIDPSLYTWNGTTLVINAAITIVGGEFIVANFA